MDIRSPQTIKTTGSFQPYMDLSLYLKEDGGLKVLKVPPYVVKDLLRDRLSNSEINRIHRLAEKTKNLAVFKPGSVVIDFNTRTAQCFQARIDVEDLEPTWKVEVEKVTLENY